MVTQQRSRTAPVVDANSYPTLLSPISLAGRVLRNRVMHASMTTELSEGRRVTDALIQYHVGSFKNLGRYAASWISG